MKSKQTPRQALNLPAGYFGMVLGTIGMGFAWRYASTLWPVSRSIGDGLVMLAIAMWALLSMAFISRAIRFPASVLREMRHPVSSSFVSLFPATTLLVAIGLVPWWRPLALGLFVPGVALQLAYAAWQSGGLWRGTHPHEATTPGLYLPTVANNFISAMACGAGIYRRRAGVPRRRGLLLVEPRAGDPPASAQRGRAADAAAHLAGDPTGACAGGLQRLAQRQRWGSGYLREAAVWLRPAAATVHAAPDALVSSPAVQCFLLELLVRYFRAGHHRPASRPGQGGRLFHHLAMPLFIFSNLVVGLLLLRTILLLVSGKLLVQVDRETLLNKKEGS